MRMMIWHMHNVAYVSQIDLTHSWVVCYYLTTCLLHLSQPQTLDCSSA